MSCGLPEIEPALAAKGAVTASPDARLRTDLSEGLHAMAQPLTILQGALWTASMPDADSAGRQRYLEMSAKQVLRLSSLLDTMRDVLATGQDAPRRGMWNLAELVGQVQEEMEAALCKAEVRIETPEDALDVSVDVDAEQTRRALRAAFRAMILSAHGSCVLQLAVCRDGEAIRLELRNAAPSVERQARPDRLNLLVAESNIVSQGGAFCFAPQPWHISFTLPASSGIKTSHAHA